MMQLSPSFLGKVASLEPRDAWRLIVDEALSICREPIDLHEASKTATLRERQVGAIDTLLCSTAWELWDVFPVFVRSNSASLVSWWRTTGGAKALLILDGLSLRELPWLLQGAQKHGFSVRNTMSMAAEIPAETRYFAKALGFSSRASLANNGAGTRHLFPLAKTECVDMPWKDAAAVIDATPSLIFWHEWPDSILHRDSGPRSGSGRFF